MSVNSKGYFINKVSVTDISIVIEKEFKLSPDIRDISNARNGVHGYIIFGDIIFYYYENNHIYDSKGERVFDTISTVCDEKHRNAIKNILKYFGGIYIAADCNEDEIFIEKTEPDFELSNEQKINQLVAKKIGHINAKDIVDFIKNNSETIKELNFGI